MNEYLLLKWLHVLSSTLLFGTGIGSAFYMYFTATSRDPRAIAIVCRWVVIADWLFTVTTVVFQPLSGYLMMRIASIPMSARWISWSFALYGLAVVCWLPVVWIQIRLRDLAAEAARRGTALPERFWVLRRWWVALGIPAFLALLAVFWLMIAKPA